MTTLLLPVDPKEWPTQNFLQMADYLGALGAFSLLHKGVGWIWDSRLICKPLRDEEDCHYALFGETVYRVRFRGWYNPETKILCVQDRKNELRNPDEIPEQLFQHLQRRFKIEPTKIRIF